MNYCPRYVIADCPKCGSDLDVKFKGVFSNLVHLQCRCGVAGPWREYSGRGDPWHDAARGWTSVFPTPDMGHPPMPSR